MQTLVGWKFRQQNSPMILDYKGQQMTGTQRINYTYTSFSHYCKNCMNTAYTNKRCDLVNKAKLSPLTPIRQFLVCGRTSSCPCLIVIFAHLHCRGKLKTGRRITYFLDQTPFHLPLILFLSLAYNSMISLQLDLIQDWWNRGILNTA